MFIRERIVRVCDGAQKHTLMFVWSEAVAISIYVREHAVEKRPVLKYYEKTVNQYQGL